MAIVAKQPGIRRAWPDVPAGAVMDLKLTRGLLGHWRFKGDPAYTTLGADGVTNGAFAADSDWVKGAGWSIAAGVASSDGSQAANSDLEQNVGATAHLLYAVTLTVTRTAGTLTPLLGTIAGSAISSAGTVTQYIQAQAATLYLRANADFVGSVDDVTVKAVSVTNLAGGGGNGEVRGAYVADDVGAAYGCLELDGSANDYVTINNPAAAFGATTVGVSVWAKFKADLTGLPVNGRYRILARGKESIAFNYIMDLGDTSGVKLVRLMTSGGTSNKHDHIDIDAAEIDGVWVCLGGTYNGTDDTAQTTLVLNNDANRTTVDPNNFSELWHSDSRMYIGCNKPAGFPQREDYFKGCIKEIMVWGRALTVQELLALNTMNG